MLSIIDGHKAVLSALSDFCVAFDENFRFETLISSLKLPEFDIDDASDTGSVVSGFGNEEEGVWEARTGTMTLVNALTNSPEEVEDRVMLREEFSRRGLNEALVVSRCPYHLPLNSCYHIIGSAIYKAP